ncbi:nickel pincer cofactor biosynthesis protein LarB [bacterium]|nr:nickel pincer cofactor biosynthesis protein LarB [bacterium]
MLDNNLIRKLLDEFSKGNLDQNEFVKNLNDNLAIEINGHTRLDTNRKERCGFSEVIYGAGKSALQLDDILEIQLKTKSNILITRLANEKYQSLKFKDSLTFCEDGKLAYKIKNSEITGHGKIIIVTAGTSDLPVALEAYHTSLLMGNDTELLSDVGVAGIHRLFMKLEFIRSARVIIAVAGMEGALPSVVGGLVDIPIIAVPTSIGYGTSFGGISALLTMLNSCSSGITVVNIDNGFGAGVAASQINHLK